MVAHSALAIERSMQKNQVGWVGGWVGGGEGGLNEQNLPLYIYICILYLPTHPPTHPPTYRPFGDGRRKSCPQTWPGPSVGCFSSI